MRVRSLPPVAIRALVGLALLGTLIVLTRTLPVRDVAVAVADTLRSFGVLGMAMYVLAYALLTSAFVPGSLLTMLAGATWGIGLGTAIVVPAATLAALLSAALGRTLLRGAAEDVVGRFRLLAALDRVFDTDALRVVTLLRLSPVMPFALCNYGLGATAAPLWAISLGTFVGLWPITLVWAYLGTLAGEAVVTGFVPESPVRTAMMVVGLVITAGIVAWVGHRARRLLAIEVRPAP